MINPPQAAFLPESYPRSLFALGMRSIADPRHSVVAAVVLSLCLHLLLLFVHIRENQESPAQAQHAEAQPLTVRLANPVARAPAPPVAQRAAPLPVPQPVPRAAPKPAPRTSSAIALSKPAPASLPQPAAVATPAAVPDSTPQMDMSAMLEARRERRRSAEDAAAHANAEAQAAGGERSAKDVAMANIKRSLQSGRSDGARGVFQVLNTGVRSGRFVFRGWTPGSRDTSQQTFEVDAGMNGDVERALVRKMIELIRKHYTGDFNWDSRQLGRVIVKSARIEDSAELEAFLMQEFFPDDRGARRP